MIKRLKCMIFGHKYRNYRVNNTNCEDNYTVFIQKYCSHCEKPLKINKKMLKILGVKTTVVNGNALLDIGCYAPGTKITIHDNLIYLDKNGNILNE